MLEVSDPRANYRIGMFPQFSMELAMKPTSHHQMLYNEQNHMWAYILFYVKNKIKHPMQIEDT